MSPVRNTHDPLVVINNGTILKSKKQEVNEAEIIMKICVSSTGNTLEADVDQRFGRCHYFVIIDNDTMQIKTLSNEATLSSGGAGIQAAQIVTKEKVDVVITGNIGPNAFQILQAAGIRVFTGAQGTIREAFEKYQKGTLQETGSANVESHAGIGDRK